MNLDKYMINLTFERLALYNDLEEFLLNKGVEDLVQAELIKKLSLEDFDKIQKILNKINKLDMELEELSVKSINITNSLKQLNKNGYI